MVRSSNYSPILYGITDLYKSYWWSLTDGRKWMVRYHRTKYHVDKKTFNAILEDFNNALIRGKMIEKGIAIRIPFFGELVFGKYKPKVWYDDKGRLRKDRLPVDWEKTYKLWREQYPGLTDKELEGIKGKKAVYNLNAHTDGYRFKLYWFRGRCHVVNNSAYRFTLMRKHQRYLAKLAKEPENGIDFREIDYTKFKKRRKYERVHRTQEEVGGK